jgi:hypothetical protein
MVHRFSGGIPRIINNICDNALLTGFSEVSTHITDGIINDVVEGLDLNSIEILSAKTMAEAVIQPDRRPTQPTVRERSGFDRRSNEQAAPSNVKYIRPHEAAVRQANAVSAGNGKYVICSESETDSEASLTFFSRVRVSKSS